MVVFAAEIAHVISVAEIERTDWPRICSALQRFSLGAYCLPSDPGSLAAKGESFGFNKRAKLHGGVAACDQCASPSARRDHIGSLRPDYSDHEIFTRNLLSSVSAVQSASAALHISQMCSFGAVICSDM